MAMVGGTLVAMVAGRNDPGFVHNGPLAGLVAVCAGSDHDAPDGCAGRLVALPAGMFVVMFTLTQNRWKIDDVLGVWPLHGLCGAWGGIAAGIFGSKALGGVGGIAFMPQLLMTGTGNHHCAWSAATLVYGLLRSSRRPAPRSGTGVQRRRSLDPQDHRQHPSAKPTGDKAAIVQTDQSARAGLTGRKVVARPRCHSRLLRNGSNHRGRWRISAQLNGQEN
jgi:hypothetical protein